MPSAVKVVMAYKGHEGFGAVSLVDGRAEDGTKVCRTHPTSAHSVLSTGVVMLRASVGDSLVFTCHS